MNKYYPYPLFLKISGKSCVVVGGGKVALRKVNDLLEAGAQVTVVAEIPDPLIEELSQKGEIRLFKRLFMPEDVENTFLVFAATDDNAVNAEIAGIAKKNGTLVNAVDNPEPGIAAGIRRDLEKNYDVSFADYLESIGEMRQFILSINNITTDRKNRALQWLCDNETFILFIESGEEKVWEELKKIISS